MLICRFSPVGADGIDRGRRSAVAAFQARRRRHAALEAHRHVRLAAQHAPASLGRTASTPAPGAAAVRNDRVLLDQEREVHLHHFDRRVHHVPGHRADGVDAILDRPSAEAAARHFVGDVGLVRAVVRATEDRHARRGVRRRHHPLGRQGAHRQHHDLADASRHLVIGVDDRRRQLRIHDGALRRDDLDRPPAAGVRRDEVLRVRDHLDRGVDARARDRQRRIHRACHLRVGAGEVRDDPVAASS